jgi:hypothetical protein
MLTFIGVISFVVAGIAWEADGPPSLCLFGFGIAGLVVLAQLFGR